MKELIVYYEDQDEKKAIKAKWGKIQKQAKDLAENLGDFVNTYCALNAYNETPFVENMLGMLSALEDADTLEYQAD